MEVSHQTVLRYVNPKVQLQVVKDSLEEFAAHYSAFR